MQYNYYRILEVGQNASIPEIKRAYRMKAKTLHPDRNKSPKAAEAFHVVQQAYETLANPAKRNRYDIRLNFRTNQTPPRATSYADPRTRRSHYAHDEEMRRKADEKRFNPHPILLASLFASAVAVGVLSVTVMVFQYNKGDMPWYTFFALLPAVVLMFEGGSGLIKDETAGVFSVYKRVRKIFVPHWD